MTQQGLLRYYSTSLRILRIFSTDGRSQQRMHMRFLHDFAPSLHKILVRDIPIVLPVILAVAVDFSLYRLERLETEILAASLRDVLELQFSQPVRV
mmetsp:Transcript_14437/g.54513  ORF Transcript_14437/g.54513 Transcript_14437/m.54513 type:complete len:96 (+) Transcript_14437:1058-1345(+)